MAYISLDWDNSCVMGSVRRNYQSHFDSEECNNLKYYDGCKFLANYNQKKDKVTVGTPGAQSGIASVWIG